VSAMNNQEVELVLDQLNRLTSRSSFSNKKRLAQFLRFVVTNTLNGQTSCLKETVIGVEVYGREPGYDPKVSPIVRTEARRLRSALEEYFAVDGSNDPVIIRMPKGSYLAEFEFRTKDIPVESVAAPAVVQLIPRQPWWRSFTGSAGKMTAAFLSICLVATATYTFMNGRHPATTWSARPFSRLGGVESFPTFSPDGKRVAFSWSGPKNDNPDIYIQEVGEDTATRVTTDPAEDNRPAWSPDGTQLAFIRLRQNSKKLLKVISIATRRETTVAELEGSHPWLCIIPRISWSADGRTLITSEAYGMSSSCGVVAIDLKTHEVRRVTEPPPGFVGDLEPQLSPDGRHVAFLRNTSEMNGDIYVTNLTGGSVRRTTFDNRDIMGFSWRPDGQSFVASSRRGDGIVKLWQLGIPDKTAEQLTDGSSSLAFPTVASRGDRIAYTQYRHITNIWKLDGRGSTLLIGNESGNSNPVLSPDGKHLLFRSDRTGAFELWTSDPDGRNNRRLTHFNGPMVSNPVWSPDGKSIAFECRSSAQSDICLVKVDGTGEPTRVTEGEFNEILPSWSRDGRSIYFSSNRTGRWQAYRQSLDSTYPTAISIAGGMRAVESWDGEFVYVHRGPSLGGIVRLPVKVKNLAATQTAEAKILLGNLGGGEWGNWDVSPEGLVYLSPNHATGFRTLRLFDPVTGSDRILQKLSISSPDGDRVLSVDPDGRSFHYVAVKSYEGNIGMLVQAELTSEGSRPRF
jgi:Tol biopolymer transport system component